jgi:adenine-specific DNA glycosylase
VLNPPLDLEAVWIKGSSGWMGMCIEFKKGAHHWLILHGRYVCKARTPECWQCAISHLCAHKPKTPDPAARAALAPKPAKPAASRRRAKLI